MMIDQSKMKVVADIFFSQKHSSGEGIHCLCSRAFVQDRELYQSDNRFLSSDLADNAVQEEDHEEAEEEEVDEEEEDVLNEEAQLMASMGLPLAFVSSSDQKRAGMRSNNKAASYWAAPPEEDEYEHPVVENQVEKEEVSDPLEERAGGKEETQSIQDVGWETYWAQQGEALLWHGWLEKHPETQRPSTEYTEMMTTPWDNPDTRAAWQQHSTETYYYYWEQYSYWAGQGWTADHSVCSGNTDGKAATRGMEAETEANTVDWWDGETGVERSQQGREKEGVKSSFLPSDVGVSDYLIGQNCDVEVDTSNVVDLIVQMSLLSEVAGQCNVSEQQEDCVCGTDEPSDGGNNRKRASSSSTHSTAENKGNNGVTHGKMIGNDRG